MFAVRAVIYEPGTDVVRGMLPQPVDGQASFPLSDDGALRLTYAARAVGGGLLADVFDLGVEINWLGGVDDWEEMPGARFVAVTVSGDSADPAGVVSITGQSYAAARMAGGNGDLAALETSGDFAGQRLYTGGVTAGQVMGSQLAEWAARHPGRVYLDWDFTATHDSLGSPWPVLAADIGLPYGWGQSHRDILADLTRRRMCDWRTQGRTLQLLVADSTARDLSATVRLQLSRDIAQAPWQTSTADLAGTFHVRGEGIALAHAAPGVPDLWAATEAYLTASGATTHDEALAAAKGAIDARSSVSASYTRELLLADHGPLPGRDYWVGDTITAPASSDLAAMRVEQITLTWGRDVGGAVTLGGRRTPLALRTASQVHAAGGGATPVRVGETTPPQVAAKIEVVADAAQDAQTAAEAAIASAEQAILDAGLAATAAQEAHDAAESAIADAAAAILAAGEANTAIDALANDVADQQAVVEAQIDALGVADVTVNRLAVTGGARIPLAVIQSLVAEQGFFESLSATRVVVSGSNLLVDPLMLQPAAWSSSAYRKNTGGYSGFGCIEIPAGAGQLGLYNAQAGLGVTYPYAIRTEVGCRYRMAARVKTGAACPIDGLSIYVRWFDAAGAQVGVVSKVASNSVALTAGQWYRIWGVTPAAPDGSTHFAVGLFTEASYAAGLATFSDPTVIEAATGSLVVDGAIDGKTVTGATLQTIATAARGIKITTGGLVAYDATGVATLTIDATTGAISMLGALTSGSTITGATVTGGTLRTTATSFRGIKVTTAGLIAYDASGVATLTIDADTGAISMLGALTSGSTITGSIVRGSDIATRDTGFNVRLLADDILFRDGTTVRGSIRANSGGTYGLTLGGGLTLINDDFSVLNGTSRLHTVEVGAYLSSYMQGTTSSPNVVSAGNTTYFTRSSSLRALKLDREEIGADYAVLDLPAMTWRDRGEVWADPDTEHRIAGFVAEDVAVVSAYHGHVLDPLLTTDDTGDLQGVAYDRIVAYLLPVVRDMHSRIAALESAT